MPYYIYKGARFAACDEKCHENVIAELAAGLTKPLVAYHNKKLSYIRVSELKGVCAYCGKDVTKTDEFVRMEVNARKKVRADSMEVHRVMRANGVRP